jgi:transcriptional regulator with XRE-family HTH domain
MKLNEFGKYLRKYRIDHDLTAKAMAETLHISPAWLSGMETGSKPIPSDMAERIARAYNFDEIQTHKLQLAADNSRWIVRIKVPNDPLSRQLVGLFAGNLHLLTVEQKLAILEILEKKENSPTLVR